MTIALATHPDAPADGEAGLAPEITGMSASLNESCGIDVEVLLAGQTAPGALIDGDAVGIYLDTDGNPATGSPT